MTRSCSAFGLSWITIRRLWLLVLEWLKKLHSNKGMIVCASWH